MHKSAKFFLASIVAFLVVVNSAYSGDNAKMSAKNNQWVESFRNAVKELDSQQAYDICGFITRKLVLGKFNFKLGKIESLEKKKISNPIFLVLLSKEDRKDPYWKKILSASPAQFVPAMRAIVIDSSVSYSTNARALLFARACWMAYAVLNGQYDQNAEWRAQNFLTRFLECFGEDGYTSLAYTVANKLAQKIPEDENWEQGCKLSIPKEDFEELWNFLWITASEGEREFVEQCFKIHLAFIMIEQDDQGMGSVSLRKTEYMTSLSLPDKKTPQIDHNHLYRR